MSIEENSLLLDAIVKDLYECSFPIQPKDGFTDEWSKGWIAFLTKRGFVLLKQGAKADTGDTCVILRSYPFVGVQVGTISGNRDNIYTIYHQGMRMKTHWWLNDTSIILVYKGVQEVVCV